VDDARMTDREAIDAWHEALGAGDDARARALLPRLPVRRGMVLDIHSDRLEQTLLHDAAAHGRPAVVRALLDGGADPNALAREGTPPLYWALAPERGGHRSERAAIVAMLVAAGARLDGLTAQGHPLHWACAAGDLALARAIAERGVSLDLHTPGRLSPLHCGAGHLAIVEWLLERGVSTAHAGEPCSALACAFYAKALGCASRLHAAGSRLLEHEHDEVLGAVAELGRDGLERAIACGADVNARNDDTGPILHRAVDALDAAWVADLIDVGARVDATDAEGRTPLDVLHEQSESRGDDDPAALERESQVMTLLVAAGAKPGKPPRQRVSLYERFSSCNSAAALEGAVRAARLRPDAELLDFAVRRGTPRLVRDTLARGATLAMLAPDAIYEVARLGETDSLAALLEAGLDPDGRGPEGEPLVHGPVDYHLHDGVAERLQLLLDRGAQVDARDRAGWTALLRAAAGGQADDSPTPGPLQGRTVPEALAALERAGARLDVRSHAGTTVLYAACLGGLAALARRAVDVGCDPRAANAYGHTPLHAAAIAGDPELVRWLCACGADPNARTCAGATPLHAAIASLKVDAVRELLARDVEIDARDTAGRTPLALACEVGLHAATPLLLARGADPSAHDILHRTPLHRACESSTMHHMSMLIAFTPSDELERVEHQAASVGVAGADLLLAAGAAVNAVDLDGNTPLHVAAEQRLILQGDARPEMCERLIAAGADPTLANDQGHRPVDRAISPEIRAYLEAVARS
jgi:ankyrin repeat protein